MGIFSIVVFYVNPKYRILNLAGRTTSCLTASSMILYLCTPENTVVLTFCGAVFKSLKFVSIRYFGSCVQNGYMSLHLYSDCSYCAEFCDVNKILDKLFHVVHTCQTRTLHTKCNIAAVYISFSLLCVVRLCVLQLSQDIK